MALVISLLRLALLFNIFLIKINFWMYKKLYFRHILSFREIYENE